LNRASTGFTPWPGGDVPGDIDEVHRVAVLEISRVRVNELKANNSA